jgi:hypothetical protein
MNKAKTNGSRAEMLGAEEIDRLATYNAEVRRGLVHNDAWREDMAQLQEIYNRQMANIGVFFRRFQKRKRKAFKVPP